MKTLYRPFLAPALVALLSVAAHAAVFNFETPGEYSGNFNSNIAVGSGPFPFAQSVTGGLNGSGSLQMNTIGGTGTDDGTAVLNRGSASFINTGDTLSASMFFLTGGGDAANGQKPLQLGFITNALSTFNADAQQPALAAFTTMRLNSTSGTNFDFQVQEKPTTGGTVNVTNTNLVLADNTWYKMSLTVVNTAGVNTYDISGSLENWGPTGAAFVSTAATFPVTSRTVTGIDTPTMFFGFREAGVSNAANFDGIVTSVVPEPASAVLFLGGLSLCGIRRRKRRNG